MRKARGAIHLSGRPTGNGRLEERRAMTEKQLLDRFITANDPDAFRALIDLHGPMVFAVCRTVLRETHDAEDAFQNTFLALARRAAMIKNGETVAPWLHRVALRVAKKGGSGPRNGGPARVPASTPDRGVPLARTTRHSSHCFAKK